MVSLQCDQTIKYAADMMGETGYSQFPVFKGNMPVGSISERDIFDLISSEKSIDDVYGMTISMVMGESFPVVPDTTPITSVAGIMSNSNAVLVSSKGVIVGVLTKADILKLL